MSSNSRDESLMQIPGSANFVVFSVGKNQIGGFNMQGVNFAPCDASHTGDDLINCQEMTDANFRSSSHADASGSGEYDDYLIFNNPSLTFDLAGWRFGSPLNSENENDVITDRKVKIGKFTDEPRADFDIVGEEKDLKTTKNFLVEEDICDFSASGAKEDCLRIERLKRTCPAGQYITGVGSTTDDFANPTNIICSPLAFSCPIGQTISGVDTDGNISCVPMPIPSGSFTPTIPPDTCGATKSDDVRCDPSNAIPVYQKFYSFSCDTGNWNYTGNNETSACCSLDPSADYDTVETDGFGTGTESYGSPEDVCGRYGKGTNDRTRGLNVAACEYKWTVTRKLCTCIDPRKIYVKPSTSSPVNYDRNIHHIERCGIRDATYRKDSSDRCTIQDLTWVDKGAVKLGVFKWASGQSTGEQGPKLDGMRQVGEPCTMGSSMNTCVSRLPVSGEPGIFTYMIKCSCDIANDPKSCNGVVP